MYTTDLANWIHLINFLAKHLQSIYIGSWDAGRALNHNFNPNKRKNKRSMKATVWISHLLLLALFCSRNCRAIISDDGVEFIEQVCNTTDYPDLCIATLRSDPRSSSADVKELCHIILEKTQANATETVGKAQRFFNQTTDPAMKECFQACMDDYENNANKYLPDAIRSLELKAYEDAAGNASAAIDEAIRCEQSFGEVPKASRSPLTVENDTLFHLCVIALRIISSLG